MTKYALKRIGMALLTLLIIVFLLFLLVRIMPGNPSARRCIVDAFWITSALSFRFWASAFPPMCF